MFLNLDLVNSNRKGYKMNIKAVIVEKTSKAGKPYKVLQITFPNGYVFETYLNNEQSYIIELNLNK